MLKSAIIIYLDSILIAAEALAEGDILSAVEFEITNKAAGGTRGLGAGWRF